MDRMMLAPSVLPIVGTDTGVGKTWTGCAWLGHCAEEAAESSP